MKGKLFKEIIVHYYHNHFQSVLLSNRTRLNSGGWEGCYIGNKVTTKPSEGQVKWKGKWKTSLCGALEFIMLLTNTAFLDGPLPTLPLWWAHPFFLISSQSTHCEVVGMWYLVASLTLLLWLRTDIHEKNRGIQFLTLGFFFPCD